MQVVRYFADWNHCPGGISVVQYAAGKCYPLTEETGLHAAQGHAELVDVYVDVEEAEKLVEKADKKLDAATAAAEVAQGLLEAARVAEIIRAADALEQSLTASEAETDPEKRALLEAAVAAATE